MRAGAPTRSRRSLPWLVTRVTAKEPYARKDPEISDLGPNSRWATLRPSVKSCRHGSLWCTCPLRDRISAPATRPSRKSDLPTICFRVRSLLPVTMATGRLGVEETLGALNAALGPGSPVWFKETRARHLRARDFLAPQRALQARFRDGEVGVGRAGICGHE